MSIIELVTKLFNSVNDVYESNSEQLWKPFSTIRKN